MIFNIKKRVCFCDTDAGGIVYHSKYLDFCEEARLEYFIENQITQDDLINKYNLMFVIRDCEVHYKKPAKLEDLLTVSIEDFKIDKLLITVYQNIYRDKELITECKISIVAVNPKNLRPIRELPQDIFKIV